MTRLVIEPVGLHWLYDEEPTDLCAHGGIRVSLDGNVVFEQGTQDDGFTLSTGALHLLRAIERDYEPGSASSGQLLPCCGNWMVFDPDLGEVVNSNCPNGIEWTIRHLNGSVEVSTSDTDSFVVDQTSWKRAVSEFSARVRAFYFADPPRVVSDETDADWYWQFVEEWSRRHAGAL